MQCCLYFGGHPGIGKQIKLTQFMSFLTKEALTWATVLWQGEKHILNYEQFINMFLQVFDNSPEGK